MGKKTKQPEAKPDYIKLRREAYKIVVEQGKTQKRAAQILGVTEKCMSEWAIEGNWRDLRKMRQSTATSARENIQSIIDLLSEKRLCLEYRINEAIDAGDKDAELRYRKEANTLSADMRWQGKNLEGLDKDTEISLGVYMDVFDAIFSDMRKYNPDLFEQSIDFQTSHLRRKRNE
ncbi:hypothetical protein FACS1894179_06950 [Bacteroidia bacterium]|nr:hypothetical protein FACS1894179_06950 [Bacteroidia bacterium]